MPVVTKTISVVSVQVGTARKVQISGRNVLTAIHKTQVTGPVPVNALGLLGDTQADPTVHGGLEKAVYAYPVEHYPSWRSERSNAGVTEIDAQLEYGAIGENLTLSGLLETDVWVGDLLRFPSCLMRVEQPREPCFKFNAAMGYNTASRQMASTGFSGFYLSVEEPGTVQAGDLVTLMPGPRRIRITERFAARMFKHLR